MGLKAAVQALKKAEPLKDKVQRCKDLLNDSDAWLCQQQLRKIYQQVLILDLEYALDRKVEQELWNLGFKNYIATLQSQAKDHKNPKRGESQALLSWCLEAASGFYLTLLQEICNAFNLDVPFKRKNYVYGYTSSWKSVEKLSPPHKSSCFYVCQYCLVHLGDIARYRNQNKQAELFYRHAVALSPSSGQPYNQLALLEASRGDKLGTAFHYVRSVSVKHPFPVATVNLSKTLTAAINDNSFNIDGKTKLTSQEYITVFLKFHGVLHNLGDLRTATFYAKLLSESLTALVVTESLSSWKLVQMLIINLYALHHIAGMSGENMELVQLDQLSSDEKISRTCILNLIAGSLSAMLLPVYTIKNSFVNYFALPTIKLCLEWIHLKPSILEEESFRTRLQIWPSLCILLNGLQCEITDFDRNKYIKVPLPEDRDTQGFLPLEKSFELFRFSSTDVDCELVTLNKLRAARIIGLGHKIAEYKVNGTSLINVMNVNEDVKFVSYVETTPVSNELLKELEELSLNKDKLLTATNSPVPSETASSKGSLETDSSSLDFNLEKKIGYLKPQGFGKQQNGSPTMTIYNNNSNGRSDSTVSSPAPTVRKPRQNIAMQALMKRAENEQKQVTFKMLSPVTNEDANINITDSQPQQQTFINTNSLINSPVNNSRIGKQKSSTQSDTSNSNTNQLTAQNYFVSPTAALLPKSIPNKTYNAEISNILQQSQELDQQYLLRELQQSSANLIQDSYSNQTFNSMPNSQFNENLLPTLLSTMSNQYPVHNQYNIAPEKIGPDNVSYIDPLSYFSSAQNNQQVGNNSISTSAMLQALNEATVSQSIGTVAQNSQIQQAIFSSALANTALDIQIQNQINLLSQNLAAYPTNLEQVVNSTSNVPISVHSSNALTNIPLNFDYSNNVSQNDISLLNQKQMPSVTNANSHFNFPDPPHLNELQQQNSNAFGFNKSDSKDFYTWNSESQPPQPPATWWGNNADQAINNKDSIKSSDFFQNWPYFETTVSDSMSGIPLTPGNKYKYSNSSQNTSTYNDASFEHSTEFDLGIKQSLSSDASNTYSLFSGNTWSTTQPVNLPSQSQIVKSVNLNQQSLWSGPGPSPLERLLEQQKSLREGGS